MKVLPLRLSTQRIKDSQASRVVAECLQQDSERSHTHTRRIVLLSLKKPHPARNYIRNLVQEKQPHSPLSRPQNLKTDHNDTLQNQSLQIFKSNLRSIISKSLPYVGDHKHSPSQPRPPQKGQRPRNREPNAAQQAYERSNTDFTKISQYLNHPKIQKEEHSPENREGHRPQKHKVAYFMNNFMKTRHSKMRKVSMDSDLPRPKPKPPLERSGFFPWERSLEPEEEALTLPA